MNNKRWLVFSYSYCRKRKSSFCTELAVFPHVKNCDVSDVLPPCKLACLLVIVSSILPGDLRLLIEKQRTLLQRQQVECISRLHWFPWVTQRDREYSTHRDCITSEESWTGIGYLNLAQRAVSLPSSEPVFWPKGTILSWLRRVVKKCVLCSGGRGYQSLQVRSVCKCPKDHLEWGQSVPLLITPDIHEELLPTSPYFSVEHSEPTLFPCPTSLKTSWQYSLIDQLILLLLLRPFHDFSYFLI